MRLNDPGLFPIRDDDVEEAQSVLREAFAHDPFFQYMLAGLDHREAIARAVHSFILSVGRRYGEVYAPGRTLEGVAIWLPPGRTTITAWKACASGVAGVFRRAGKDIFRYGSRMLAYARYADKVHEKNAPREHWYLLAIGVREKYRGRGFASKLIKPMLARFDHDGVPCYLETHHPQNVGLYRHFGFEVMKDCTMPGSDKSYWAMLRKPQERFTF